MAQRIMSEAAGQVLADEIKSNTSGLASLAENYEVYSTSERKCGTWIDGKTLYRKCINVGNVAGGGSKSFQFGVSNLEVLVTIKGTARSSAFNSIVIPSPIIAEVVSVTKWMIDFRGISKTGATINVGSGYTEGFTDVIVIIEYTKTT